MYSFLYGQAPRYLAHLCTAATSIHYSAFFGGSAMPAQHIDLA